MNKIICWIFGHSVKVKSRYRYVDVHDGDGAYEMVEERRCVNCGYVLPEEL